MNTLLLLQHVRRVRILTLYKFDNTNHRFVVSLVASLTMTITSVIDFGENKMRLDKFLKVSRLIKRRTVANEACDAGRVMVNDRVAKASADVKEGDVIEISFGNKTVKVEVLDIRDTTKKEEAKEMFKYL